MITKDRAFLGTGFRFPVRIGPNGGFAFSSGEQNIQEAIWIILGTSPGERQMRGRFGCGIKEFVFAPNTPGTHGAIAQAVRTALTKWEPRIDVSDVRVSSAPSEENKMLIRIDYRVRATNDYHNVVYPFFIREGGAT